MEKGSEWVSPTATVHLTVHIAEWCGTEGRASHSAIRHVYLLPVSLHHAVELFLTSKRDNVTYFGVNSTRSCTLSAEFS